MPRAETLLEAEAHDDLCRKCNEALSGIQQLVRHSQRIALAAGALGEAQSVDLKSVRDLSQLLIAPDWMKVCDLCGK